MAGLEIAKMFLEMKVSKGEKKKIYSLFPIESERKTSGKCHLPRESRCKDISAELSMCRWKHKNGVGRRSLTVNVWPSLRGMRRKWMK